MNNDLISRSELKKEFDIIASNSATGEWQLIPIKHIKQIIDNAPTANLDERVIQEVLNKRCMTAVANEHLIELHGKRSQGECKTCRHRDPEDKKCDCGALERQGCPFPVSDDYYCKYYEKGGEEE